MPAQYLLCTRTMINEGSFLCYLSKIHTSTQKKKNSLLFLNANILWPWERLVVKCFQATIKAQDNKTQKKSQSPENTADSKDQNLALLKKNNIILCGSNNAEEMLTSCAGAVQHHLLQRWTQIPAALCHWPRNRGSCCHGQSQGGTHVPFFLSFPLGVFS